MNDKNGQFVRKQAKYRGCKCKVQYMMKMGEIISTVLQRFPVCISQRKKSEGPNLEGFLNFSKVLKGAAQL